MDATRVLIALIVFALCASGASAQDDTVTYMHTDGIGSVRMLTNENREVVARYDYFPFGELCPESACGNPPSTATTRQYAGQERDSETGLDYFGARYYGAINGRFTTVDPDHVAGNLVDPQRWNAYAYARNNPFAFVDWLGLAPCPKDTDTSTCVEGKAGTGEVVYDIWFSHLRAGASLWWQAQKNDENQVKGASPFGPAVFRGFGATASVAGTRSTALLAQAATTVSNKGAVAASREAALEAAERWVGIGARLIRSRSGQVVGKISADGQRIYRTTSMSKAQPYINLENKATGGNLHVRW